MTQTEKKQNKNKTSIAISFCLKAFAEANYSRGKVEVGVDLLWTSECFFPFCFALSLSGLPSNDDQVHPKDRWKGGVQRRGGLVQEEVTCRIPMYAGEG